MKGTNFKAGILKRLRLLVCLLGLLLAADIAADAQARKMWLKVNPSPKCGTDDICYEVMNFPKEGTAFGEIKSDFFYAVVLRTTEECGVSEKERRAIQELFPKNKVFTSTMDCELSEDNTSYENIGENGNGFIAVYAGRSKAEAEKFLQTVKAKNKFPGANVRKTRVVFSGT